MIQSVRTHYHILCEQFKLLYFTINLCLLKNRSHEFYSLKNLRGINYMALSTLPAFSLHRSF